MYNRTAILILVAVSSLMIFGYVNKDRWGELFTGTPATVEPIPGGLSP